VPHKAKENQIKPQNFAKGAKLCATKTKSKADACLRQAGFTAIPRHFQFALQKRHGRGWVPFLHQGRWDDNKKRTG
jgi:hypothetical protein